MFGEACGRKFRLAVDALTGEFEPVAEAPSPTSGLARNCPDSVCHKLRWRPAHLGNTSAPSCDIAPVRRCPKIKIKPLKVPLREAPDNSSLPEASAILQPSLPCPAAPSKFKLTQISNLTAVSSMWTVWVKKAAPIVLSWYSWNCPLTNLSTSDDLPTADSPSSTNLNWQILLCVEPLGRWMPLPRWLFAIALGCFCLLHASSDEKCKWKHKNKN